MWDPIAGKMGEGGFKGGKPKGGTSALKYIDTKEWGIEPNRAGEETCA